MNLSILFITILIFINTIGYGTFELKNKNKLERNFICLKKLKKI